MKDELGERIKSQYEDRTRFFIPRRTFTILRLDGKAFHTYTRGLNKPFDDDLIEDIDSAIIALLPEIQGAVFAYTQSDEISILLTDFATPQTSAWFDGNVQKMASVSASIMTAQFNLQRLCRIGCGGIDRPLDKGAEWIQENYTAMAYFDSRLFTIPDRIEVMNYFIWRNQDCARNSVSMLAQSLFSHKQLQGKSTLTMIGMIKAHESGAYSWDDLNQGFRFGRVIMKETYVIPNCDDGHGNNAERTRWTSNRAWKFTEDKDKLLNMIPKYE